MVHAAGESLDGPVRSGTHAVVLAARDEAHLLEVARALERRGLPFTLILEPDPPWSGAAMAIGVAPTRDRAALRRALGRLSLLE